MKKILEPAYFFNLRMHAKQNYVQSKKSNRITLSYFMDLLGSLHY